MKTLFDYLKYYGNETFDVFPFNEVDGLVLAMLSYTKFDGIVPKHKSESISFRNALKVFFEKYSPKDFKSHDWMFPVAYKLMEALRNSKRFEYAKIYYLVTSTDSHGQFGAITIRLPNGITYISYEGTDSSIVGWKEDFELMYMAPISSQRLALQYFDETLNVFDREVYVGGHSKGGNLAMYAYMYGKPYYKRRVKKIYNFDGPGFLNDIFESDIYQEMTRKLETIVPHESVVGMMLNHGKYRVVNSKNKGIMQHEGTSWECFGGCFVDSTLSKKSEKLERNLKEYLDGMTVEEKKNFVETIFAVFERSNITNVMQLKEVSIGNLLAIMKGVKNIPSSTKRNLVAILRILITGIN